MVSADLKAPCCWLGQHGEACDEEAEWLIETVRRGGGIAGPDLYCDTTEACTRHVGDLLGYQPECHDPEDVYWHVVPLSMNGERS